MRKTFLSLAVLALVAAPAFAGKYNKVLSIGDKAPTFDALPAVEGTGDTSLSLSDIKEDVVVIGILANHCPAVVANDDRIIDMVGSLKGQSVKFIGLSVTAAAGQKELDDIAGIKSRSKEKHFNYVYGYDESQKVGKAYGAAATPTFFVLDKARTVRYMGALDNSPMDESKAKTNYVKNAVEALLSGKDVEVTETKAVGCGIGYQKN